MKAIGNSFTAENDLVARLPIEISEIIFRQLDPQSLLNAARVSKKWRDICSGDSELRYTAKHHLLKKKRQLLQIEPSRGKKMLTRKSVVFTNARQISLQRHESVSFFYGSSGVTTFRRDMKSRRKLENSSMPNKRITMRF